MTYAQSSIYQQVPGLPYQPQPKRPRTWQGQRFYQATVGGINITVHAADKAEALIKIMAIVLEHGVATV